MSPDVDCWAGDGVGENLSPPPSRKSTPDVHTRPEPCLHTMARHIAHAVLALAILAAATPLARGAHLRASYTPGQPPVETDMDARRWLAHMAHAHGADVSSVPMAAPGARVGRDSGTVHPMVPRVGRE